MNVESWERFEKLRIRQVIVIKWSSESQDMLVAVRVEFVNREDGRDKVVT